MPDYRSKTVCVSDNGLFVELAITLAKSFGKVYYHAPWDSAFPRSNDLLVGKGIPEIQRVEHIWGILDEIDLFVYPDIYHGLLQEHLVSMGKRVWGSRRGDEMELARVPFKKHLASLGLPVGPYAVVIGLDALREYLKTHDDQWVKISKTRGDFETFHAKDYAYIEPLLDGLEHRLGAKKKITEFVVEENIEAVELGWDGYCIDGQFPQTAMLGIEVKDKCLIAVVKSQDQMPEQSNVTNGRLAETFRRYHYRNFFSTELRITKDGQAYLTDPCARMGAPPGALMLMMYTNLPDILWYGAAGELVEPAMAAPFGADIVIRSEWADQNWQAVQFPPELREHVKLRNLTVIGGQYYVVPRNVGLPEIGEIVAVGQSIDEATTRALKIAEQVRGYYLEVFSGSFEEAEDEIDKLKKLGIDV